MHWKNCGVLLFGIVLAFVHANTEAKDDEKDVCRGYNYCKGINFKDKQVVKGRTVMCEQNHDSKKECCLPQHEHMVCYGINVDRAMLNLNDVDPFTSTDYEALCEALLTSVGKEPARYSGVTVNNSTGGMLIYRDQAWQQVSASDAHVGNLACSYKVPKPDS